MVQFFMPHSVVIKLLPMLHYFNAVVISICIDVLLLFLFYFFCFYFMCTHCTITIS